MSEPNPAWICTETRLSFHLTRPCCRVILQAYWTEMG